MTAVPLKFRTLRNKRSPIDFCNLDEAIDQLGNKLFPEEWGLLPFWEKLPFSVEKSSGKFYRCKLISDGPGAYRFKKLYLKLSEEAHQTAKLYEETIDAFSRGAERLEFRAAKLGNDRRDFLAQNQNNIWSTQR